MKFLISVLLLCSATFASASQMPTKEIVVSIHDVYVPGGFSSESDAYIIVNGVFPNSCYRWDRARVHNAANNVHEIISVAKVTQGMCLQVLVPYSKEVRLGTLERGTHTLRFMNGDGTFFERSMEIE